MAENRMERGGMSRGGGIPVSPAALAAAAATLVAGGAASLLPGVVGWAVTGAIVLAAAWIVARLSAVSSAVTDFRARALLSVLEHGGSPEARTPPTFSGEWSALYERMNRIAMEARIHAAAVSELERVRRHVDLAATLLRDGKDPLTEVAELRVGPLRAVLEAAKGAAVGPVVSRLPLGEADLIGGGEDALPPTWPKGAVSPASWRDRTEVRDGLQDLIHGIESLSAMLPAAGNEEPVGQEPGTRTPAQLVDAVVLTAADGIEDLAAGLMRANELAAVAERVTNRATLLALNAALEATRSGSEAFAAIAEETRRLAEFAREATDTISRLASEIEYKVGETITAIHATSEDAKISLAELGGSAPTAAPSSVSYRSQMYRLLERARELLSTVEEAAEEPKPEPATAPTPPTASAAASLTDRDELASFAPAAADPESEIRTEAAAEITAPDAAPDPDEYSAFDPNPVKDLVENARPPTDKLPAEGVLLIEGLKPGSRLES